MSSSNPSVNGSLAVRPPAVPLVVCDPYFSVWSMSDQLTDEWTKHWTGTPHPMCGLLRIDSQSYRVMGAQPRRRRADVPAMKQISLEVLPTRTIYTFEAAGIQLILTFMTPLLPHDLDLMSRPTTFLTWDIKAIDGKEHDVTVYFDVGATLVVNTPEQHVVWGRYKIDDLSVLGVGSRDQRVTEKAGDNLRIDWGYLYLVVPPQGSNQQCITSDLAARGSFIEQGVLPESDDLEMPQPANDRAPAPVLACMLDMGTVGAYPQSRYVLLAYDDHFSVEYFHRKLRPYWRRTGKGASELLKEAAQDYKKLMKTCRAYDAELMADLASVGGDKYARLAALSFRQCIAAHKLVADLDGTPLYFSKENFSNGCMGTVDVTYPSSPFFLLFNPELLKAQVVPVLDYAKSNSWRFPFAPHDLGRYPLANGQVYGGGEISEVDQMPVEECGNMLLMLAALAEKEGDTVFLEPYWPLLHQWAAYLRENGPNPKHQLCTDDFAGHLAQNVNLSLKAILALGAYASLLKLSGMQKEAAHHMDHARSLALQWKEMADDGDHYRLTFDREGTWSQKYNLVWDVLLDLHLFTPEIARKELAFYKTRMERYGLPLDNRSAYTKLDWIVWTATLAEHPHEFEEFIAPVYSWLNETPSRVPLTDWYWADDGKQAGFQARSVVGGVYIKLLTVPDVRVKWRRYAAAADRHSERPPTQGVAHVSTV